MNYTVDFNLQVHRLLPTFLRQVKQKSWLRALLKPIQSAFELDVLFMNGALEYSFWDASYVIAPGQRVRRHGKVYENISGVNQNGPDPINSPLLYKEILPEWRGVKRMIRYNSQLVILEYVLNEWFNLNFEQPVYGSSAHSDIYITLNEAKDEFFTVFEDIERSSAVYESAIMVRIGVFEDTTPLGDDWDVMINYPLSEISGTADPKFKELMAMVNQYMVYGTVVAYQGY